MTSRKWCGGKTDPSAPHDLTLFDAIDRKGACKKCKRYTTKHAKRRSRAEQRKAIEEAAANPPDPNDYGIPAFPRNPTPVWHEPRSQGALLDVLSVLFDPWPDYPTAPEDYSDFQDGEIPRHFHTNSPEAQRRNRERRSKARHRKALAERAEDPTWSEYNRRLARLALLA